MIISSVYNLLSHSFIIKSEESNNKARVIRMLFNKVFIK